MNPAYVVQIREGRLQGVGQCLIREYRMVCHVMKGDVSKDFVEGCRAILLDKDKNPKVHVIFPSILSGWIKKRVKLIHPHTKKYCFMPLQWEPSRLEFISEQMVDRYFSKVEDEEDLKLPARSNLPPYAIAKL